MWSNSFITAHAKFSIQNTEVFENLNSNSLEGCKREISISEGFFEVGCFLVFFYYYYWRFLPSVKVLYVSVKIRAW